MRPAHVNEYDKRPVFDAVVRVLPLVATVTNTIGTTVNHHRKKKKNSSIKYNNNNS